MKLWEKALGNLTAITAVGTAAFFLAGYVYNLGFYRAVGEQSIKILAFPDYLDSLKNAFLPALLFGVVYLAVFLDVAARVSATPIARYLLALVVDEYPPDSKSREVGERSLVIAGSVGVLYLAVWAGCVLFFGREMLRDHSQLDEVVSWGCVLSLLAFFFAGLATTLAKVAQRWQRRALAASFLVAAAFFALYQRGLLDARNLLYRSEATTIIRVGESEKACVLLAVLANGYLVKEMPNGPVEFLDRGSVSRIRFLKQN